MRPHVHSVSHIWLLHVHCQPGVFAAPVATLGACGRGHSCGAGARPTGIDPRARGRDLLGDFYCAGLFLVTALAAAGLLRTRPRLVDSNRPAPDFLHVRR